MRGESNQEKEKQIMVKNKQLKDQEIENEKNEKEEKMLIDCVSNKNKKYEHVIP